MPSKRLRLLLQRFIDDDKTSVTELANVSGYATSTVYSWLSDETKDPRLDAVISWITLHPHRRMREELASVLCGQQVMLAEVDDETLDLNGDGYIDARDSLRGAIESVDMVAKVLKEVSDAARVEKLTEEMASSAVSVIHETQYQLMLTEMTLNRSVIKRKKAR